MKKQSIPEVAPAPAPVYEMPEKELKLPAVPKTVAEYNEITLPSGSKAVMRVFKGRDIREAQRIAGGESEMLMFGILSMTTTVDGQPLTVEEIDELPGFDVLHLMKALNTGFTSAPNN